MNTLTLAVAGGRKTQSVVDAAVNANANRRILVVTYTLRNQDELARRLATNRPFAAEVEVQGWFSFLLGNFVRPYLPMRFTEVRLAGLNFEGDPGRYAAGRARFFDSEGRAYRRHLSKLAMETSAASCGGVIDRLSRIYDEIFIDEVQDMNGWDLEVLSALMSSNIHVTMVGDVRQAIIQTNVEDPKNSQFKGPSIKNWFAQREAADTLRIEHAANTWRCNQQIATFADAIFDASWGFQPTVSMTAVETGHDGVFAVSTTDVDDYVRAFDVVCLRHSSASARALELPFMNIGVAKGSTFDRVVIAPTSPMLDFLRRGSALADRAACSLYVAVTRARHSVAFVVERPDELGLEVWHP